jgi:hypothetical protein
MHNRTKSILLIAGLLAVPAILAAAKLDSGKQYQVTGKVLDVTDKMIAVQKGDERWEMARSKDTKIDGDLKVGGKATVYYHMIADEADVK